MYLDASIIVRKETNNPAAYHYLHRDYLGSILAITNSAGNIVEKRHFDAWGNKILGGLTFLDRGYTGHEHLQGVGLINMNARLYDPKLHRFLAPDNFIQDPSNSQSYNRYGYVWNNPLKYNDPSGEIVWMAVVVGAVIGAVAGGASYVAQAVQTGTWNWGKFGLSVLSGAVIGGVSGAISPMAVTSAGLWQTAASSFAAGFMPSVNVPVGDWSFSISPSIAFGNSFGIGMNFSVGYNDGNFSMSGGVGIMQYGNYNGFGNGVEVRKSILASYDNNGLGMSLGTNFWTGTNGMSEFSQRTTMLGLRANDVSFYYENDGSPFNYAGKVLSNDTDMYRTAAARIGIGEFSLQMNLFTGKWGGNNQENNPELVDLSRGPNGYWKNPEANMYRMGALTIGYRGLHLGTNSEHVRDVFQNWLAHTIISPQPRFDMLSRDWKGFSKYQTFNSYTLW